jgi:nitrogenase subunit NifH
MMNVNNVLIVRCSHVMVLFAANNVLCDICDFLFLTNVSLHCLLLVLVSLFRKL